MSPEYTVEAADGFYIARNGEGVLDLADPQDYEFAEFVCAALNQAAQQSMHLTRGMRPVRKHLSTTEADTLAQVKASPAPRR